MYGSHLADTDIRQMLYLHLVLHKVVIDSCQVKCRQCIVMNLKTFRDILQA